MTRQGPLRRRARATVRRAIQRALNPSVYAAVDQRSGGRCEVRISGPGCRLWACGRLATDHHHARKPRRSWHTPAYVVHLCRACHARCAWPYALGRLVVTPLGDQRFAYELVTAFNKFTARRRAEGGDR